VGRRVARKAIEREPNRGEQRGDLQQRVGPFRQREQPGPALGVGNHQQQRRRDEDAYGVSYPEPHQRFADGGRAKQVRAAQQAHERRAGDGRTGDDD
jgi:hypothetical protein